VYQAAFRENGKEIITADLKANVRVWDTATGKLLREGKPVAALHKFDAGFAADIGGVRAWAVNGAGDRVACAGITNVSNAFAGVGNPLIQVVDPKSLKVLQEHKSKEAYQGTMWGVAIHPAGFVLGTAGGSGGMLWIWKPDQAEPLRVLKQPDNIRGMALSADGTKVALAQVNGSARVLNLKA
jgi:WD40 repeat protein